MNNPECKIELSYNWVIDFDWNSIPPDFTDEQLGKETNKRLIKILQSYPLPIIEEAPYKLTRFGFYVQTLRKDREMNRVQLARKADLDPVALALLELGKLKPDELILEVVLRINRAFRLPENILREHFFDEMILGPIV